MADRSIDSPEALIRAASLAAGYDRHAILRDVNLELRRGEFWFLVGSNGSGKTTLVRTVLGLLPPLSGRLVVEPSLLGGRSVGFVPQRSEVPPSVPMTVREFVRLGLVGIRVDRDERRTRVEEAIEIVGLAGRTRDSFASLSGGLRQRAVLARALVREPELLVLDEPTNHLDPATEDAFLDLLLRLNNELSTAVMFVTHDLDIVARMATHVALFTSGTVVAGERDAVLTEVNLSRLQGREESDGVDGPLGRVGGHG